jgi:hypothetical protein
MERFSGDTLTPNKEGQLRHTHNHLGRMNRKSALGYVLRIYQKGLPAIL